MFPFVVVRLTTAPPPPIRPRTIFELAFPTISMGYPMLTRPFVVSASSCALSSAGSMAVKFPFVVESSTPAPGSSFRISTSIAPFVVLAWAAPRVPTRWTFPFVVLTSTEPLVDVTSTLPFTVCPTSAAEVPRTCNSPLEVSRWSRVSAGTCT